MNIEVRKTINDKLWRVEFKDKESPIFRLSIASPRKRDADWMARELNLLFDRIRNNKDK